VGRISQTFFPPQYWQEFEDLTQAVFPYVFGDQTAQKVGRPGQAQNGVDVYGDSGRAGGFVGIQCKRMEERDENKNPYPGGVITERLLRAEYEKELEFRPRLTLWLFATTAKRDTQVQRRVAEMSERSTRQGCFKVGVWFWDDYVTFLNTYDDLVKNYYGTVLALRTERDEDLKILDLFATAFSRAAFHTSLGWEHGDHWFDALKDTERALNTGELVDRETRHVIRKVIGGWRSLNDPDLKSGCGKVYESLRHLRERLNEASTSRSLIKCRDGQLIIQDHKLGGELAQLRKRIVDQMNEVLASVGIPTV
jgi:hypothetical protein